VIALSNFWCWLRGKPPKWTHLNLTEVLPFAASMEPVGGSPPPDAFTSQELLRKVGAHGDSE